MILSSRKHDNTTQQPTPLIVCEVKKKHTIIATSQTLISCRFILLKSILKKSSRPYPNSPGTEKSDIWNRFTYHKKMLSKSLSKKKQLIFFEATASLAKEIPKKSIINLIFVDLAALINKHGAELRSMPIRPQHCADLLMRINDQTISNNIAKEILTIIWNENELQVDQVIENRGLKQMDNSEELTSIIRNIIAEHPKQTEQYKAGKHKLLGFFVGQVMKQTKGKANPTQVNKILLAELHST